MLRLVSQFDNSKIRASVATPTCGGCCCSCCCCVVTTLASSIITSRNLGKLAEKQAASMPSSTQTKSFELQARKIGFFLLPISIGAGFLTLFLFGENLILSGSIIVVTFALGLYVFKNKFGLSVKTAITIFILTIIGLVLEFFAWPLLLLFGFF